MSAQMRNRRSALTSYVVLGLSAALMIAPLWWMMDASLTSNAAIVRGQVPLLPLRPEWKTYLQAWTAEPFGRFMLNSLLTTTAMVVCQLATSAMAAYALVYTRLGRTRFLLAVLVAAVLVPFQATWLGAFFFLRDLGWINSYQALVVPFLGSAFGVFYLRQGFLGAIPTELVQVARLDGAHELRALWTVVLPNARNLLISLGSIQFFYHFNALFWPLVATSTNAFRVMPVGLSMFLQDEGGTGTQWNQLLAAAVIGIVPLLIGFLAGQKYIVEGVMRTAFRD